MDVDYGGDIMSISRQGLRFLAVGICLVFVDWLVFVVLTALGLGPVASNIAGRIAGALLGFWANGRITFGTGGDTRLGRYRFARYVLLWATLTFLSTLLISALAQRLDLHVAWLAKPAVEAALAVASFFLSRHWVYR